MSRAGRPKKENGTEWREKNKNRNKQKIERKQKEESETRSDKEQQGNLIFCNFKKENFLLRLRSIV